MIFTSRTSSPPLAQQQLPRPPGCVSWCFPWCTKSLSSHLPCLCRAEKEFLSDAAVLLCFLPETGACLFPSPRAPAVPLGTALSSSAPPSAQHYSWEELQEQVAPLVTLEHLGLPVTAEGVQPPGLTGKIQPCLWHFIFKGLFLRGQAGAWSNLG